GADAAQQQEPLVPGVGDRVDRFGQHRARIRHEERDELQHSDAEVREQRGDDRALRLVVFRRHYSMMPPRVIDSTSSTRSSCASLMSLRARTIERTDLPVRFDSLTISATVSYPRYGFNAVATAGEASA